MARRKEQAKPDRPTKGSPSGRSAASSAPLPPLPGHRALRLPILAHGRVWGFIDRSGKIVVEPRFQSVHYYRDGLALVAEPGATGRWGILDEEGRWVVQPAFHRLGGFSEGLCAYNKGSSWGFIDARGETRIRAKFRYVERFGEGLAAACGADLLYGFIDPDGKWAIPPKFDAAGAFRDGLCPVRLKKRWGYIDRTGATIIEPRFARAWGFRDGVAEVVSSGREDKTSFAVREMKKHFNVEEFRGKWGLIDRTGAYLAPPRFAYSESEFDHLSDAREQELGPLDREPAEVDGASAFHDGRALGREGGKFGFVDRRGEVVLEPVWDHARHFGDGLAPVGFNEKGRPTMWGYVDGTGKVAIEPRFFDAAPFSEGLAAVRIEAAPNEFNLLTGGRWGYIDTTGKMVIEPLPVPGGPFRDGLAQRGRAFTCYIDRSGRTVWLAA